MQSTPESYPIADFLKWNREKSLNLNPRFQRGSVWSDPAKSYLIDTILRGMPVPKILFRTNIDRATQQIVRDVVDGQQRLRAIIAFGTDNLRLNSRAKEFATLKYSGLDPEFQDRFLAYRLTAEQLVNASDDDVLDIFARVNSYTVPLNAPELRHAKYDSDFKWSVIDTVKRQASFWKLGTLSERDRVRMQDTALVAEMYGIVMNGVTDGGALRLDKLYESTKHSFPERARVESVVTDVLTVIAEVLGDDFHGEPIVGSPHILMLFAALANQMHGIPDGQLGDVSSGTVAPESLDKATVRDNIRLINGIIDSDDPPQEWSAFWNASKTTTQRIASRRVRFPIYANAVEHSLT